MKDNLLNEQLLIAVYRPEITAGRRSMFEVAKTFETGEISHAADYARDYSAAGANGQALLLSWSIAGGLEVLASYLGGQYDAWWTDYSKLLHQEMAVTIAPRISDWLAVRVTAERQAQDGTAELPVLPVANQPAM